ncbi:DUF389 domain-containing protein [Collinsella stercoris]|nr:DUF389 domain-containing protein [Collinsella stercoris]UEA44746.1 DUF389 domain-containing protein [Collinsella stercoris DSM 13279]UWP10787.1 DUF389 domain-containing protein [Collinsella stercoris]
MTRYDDMRQKYIDRHRRRHGERPAVDRALRGAQRFLRRRFNIREGRAPYHTIRKRFVNGARLTGTHLCILIVAMVIACIGLDTDSDIAIVGAMLICPLMGSVLAIAYGVATVDRALMRDALGGLVLQMAFCLITSTIYFVLSPVAGMTPALVDNSGPTIWHLMLALVGGFAGGLGNSRDQEPATVISGVAVATALMPPLCAAGYGLAAANVGVFLGALYEFGINVVFIALSAAVVLLLLHTPLKRDLNDDGVVTEAEDELVRAESHKIRWRIMLGTAIFAIPCVILTGNMLATTEEQAAGATDYYDAAETARELAVVCPEFKNYSIGMEVSAQAQGGDGVERQNGTKQLVARVTTSEPLASRERTIAEELIRLDAPDVERVEFSVG